MDVWPSRMLTTKAIEANDGKPLPLYQKALCGLTAGAIGACFGNPADLALIRMQADQLYLPLNAGITRMLSKHFIELLLMKGFWVFGNACLL